VERELTLTRVHHPEFIGNDWQLVDHPTVRPLTDGAPDLGWEGDPRLAIYLFKPGQRFVLWRLEANGEYQTVAQLPESASITPQSVNGLIRNLIRIDQRNGFDPYADVMGVIETAERHEASDHAARLAEFADKFHYGLSRSFIPGVDFTRIRNVPSRR